MLRAALLALVMISQQSCAISMGAIAHHNSHGTACLDNGAFTALDAVIGSVTAVALVYKGTAEESPGWLAVPGVFLSSAFIGAVGTYNCNHRDDQGTGVAQPAPKPTPWPEQPPDNVIPPDERDPIEPAIRDATPEERGMQTPTITAPAIDPDHVPPPTPKATDKSPPECQIEPLIECPVGWSCALTDGNAGTCRRDVR